MERTGRTWGGLVDRTWAGSLGCLSGNGDLSVIGCFWDHGPKRAQLDAPGLFLANGRSEDGANLSLDIATGRTTRLGYQGLKKDE